MNFDARISKLTDILQRHDCPAIAMVPGPNFYYLTGVRLGLMERPTILIVTATGDIHAAIPALEKDMWTARMPQARTVFWQDADGYADALAELARRSGAENGWGLALLFAGCLGLLVEFAKLLFLGVAFDPTLPLAAVVIATFVRRFAQIWANTPRVAELRARSDLATFAQTD